MDLLSPLFEHFSPAAKVFFTGNLCESKEFDTSQGLGCLHVLRAGSLQVSSANGDVKTIDQPSLILHPQPLAHNIRPIKHSGADLICATIDLGVSVNNPLVSTLPDRILVELADMPRLNPTLTLLVEESSQQASGHSAALNRLTEYLLILLLRDLIETGNVNGGILAGLGDPKLHNAIKAIHERPEFPWTLETLAEQAAMSRARFALRFREKTGMTPLYYLTHWRISIACSMLRKGKRMEQVASQVGYSSQSALTRVFSKQMGQSPREWMLKNKLD